jgi:hypothetical protein
LLQKGAKILNDEQVELFNELNIDVVNNIKRLASDVIKLVKKSEQNFIEFSDYQVFTDLFENKHQDFVESVFDGDLNFLNSYYNNEEFLSLDFSDPEFIDLKSIKKMRMMAYEIDEEVYDLDKLDDFLKYLAESDDDPLLDIFKAFKQAWCICETSSQESDTQNKLIEKIRSTYGLSDEQLNEKGNLILKISDEGLKKLAFALATSSDDFKIEYYHPYGGYDCNINIEHFDHELDENLNDI